MAFEYDDILNMPHHVSAKHPPMSMQSRAAQFSPFAALSGYEAMIRETARLTDTRGELDEQEKTQIDRALRQLAAHPGTEATFCYFSQDERKEGGSYHSIKESVRRVDAASGMILLDNGLCIDFADLHSITCEQETE